MAGILGTALMLLEASRLGAVIDIPAIPRPAGIPFEDWLRVFPSFGFLLSAPPENAGTILGLFESRNIAAAVIGTTDGSGIVSLRDGAGGEEIFWRFDDELLIGCAREPEHA